MKTTVIIKKCHNYFKIISKMAFKEKHYFIKLSSKLVFLLFVSLVFINFQAYSQSNVISGKSEVKKVKIKLPEENKIVEGAEAPVLRLTNPSHEQAKEGQKLEVNSDLKIFNIKGFTYVRDGSGIREVLINDDPVEINENDEFETMVLLKNDTNLYVIESWSNNGKAAYDTVTIIYNRMTGNNYLFIMAIEDYKYWPDLENPVNDAKSLIDVLTNKYEFDGANCIEMYNQQCTIDSIDVEFRNLINKVTEKDNVVIFFAGHGYYDEIINEGYWIPADGRLQSPNDYLNNSIMMKYIAALKSRHTLILADACFSGSLFADMRGETGRVNFDNYEKRKSRWAFTSGRMEEVLDASPFAKYLVDFLNTNEKEQFLFKDMADYVTTAVSRNSDQMPKAGPLIKVGDEGGQFVFKRRVEE